MGFLNNISQNLGSRLNTGSVDVPDSARRQLISNALLQFGTGLLGSAGQPGQFGAFGSSLSNAASGLGQGIEVERQRALQRAEEARRRQDLESVLQSRSARNELTGVQTEAAQENLQNIRESRSDLENLGKTIEKHANEVEYLTPRDKTNIRLFSGSPEKQAAILAQAAERANVKDDRVEQFNLALRQQEAGLTQNFNTLARQADERIGIARQQVANQLAFGPGGFVDPTDFNSAVSRATSLRFKEYESELKAWQARNPIAAGLGNEVPGDPRPKPPTRPEILDLAGEIIQPRRAGEAAPQPRGSDDSGGLIGNAFKAIFGGSDSRDPDTGGFKSPSNEDIQTVIQSTPRAAREVARILTDPSAGATQEERLAVAIEQLRQQGKSDTVIRAYVQEALNLVNQLQGQ